MAKKLVNLEKEIEKGFPLTSQNNIEHRKQEDYIKPSDMLDDSYLSRYNFFRFLFVLEKEFATDQTTIVNPLSIQNLPIDAFQFNGDTRRVNAVAINGYEMKYTGQYMFSMNMPIEFVAGVERIELFIDITPYGGVPTAIKVGDISVGTAHILLDEMFQYYTFVGTKILNLNYRDSVTFSATYHNGSNPLGGNILYKQGGTWDLHFLTQ